MGRHTNLFLAALQVQVAEHGLVCAKVEGKSSNTNEDVIWAVLCVCISLHIQRSSAGLWRETFEYRTCYVL